MSRDISKTLNLDSSYISIQGVETKIFGLIDVEAKCKFCSID